MVAKPKQCLLPASAPLPLQTPPRSVLLSQSSHKSAKHAIADADDGVSEITKTASSSVGEEQKQKRKQKQKQKQKSAARARARANATWMTWWRNAAHSHTYRVAWPETGLASADPGPASGWAPCQGRDRERRGYRSRRGETSPSTVPWAQDAGCRMGALSFRQCLRSASETPRIFATRNGQTKKIAKKYKQTVESQADGTQNTGGGLRFRYVCGWVRKRHK